MKATGLLDKALGAESTVISAVLAREVYPEPGELPLGFAEWFQGSRMIETNGRPRPFYHGSHARFDHFQCGQLVRTARRHWGGIDPRQRDPQCIYLSADPLEATMYGQWVMLAYLRMTNPFRASHFSEVACVTQERRLALTAEGFDGVWFGDRFRSEIVIFDPRQAWIVASYPSAIGSQLVKATKRLYATPM